MEIEAAKVIGAGLAVIGFIGSGITGFYVDTTRKYIDLAKIFGLLLCAASALVVIVSFFSTSNVTFPTEVYLSIWCTDALCVNVYVFK